MLRAQDLKHDPVLVRRINRLQKEKAREAEHSDAEEEGGLAVSQRPTPSVQPRIKVSPSSTPRLQVPSTQEAPISSVVDDLGSSDEDE
jgi:hypothetical protein